ncbi:MAG: FAD binding domain-containing protein [Acidimicrobiales bacterium]
MKLPPLEYHAPSTLEGVLDLLFEHGDEAKVMAGGQSLMPMMAMRLARPAQLVDINDVSSLDGIDDRGDLVAFGATTRERDVERSRLVAERLPVLSEALPFIGHVSIRNRGTIGGSIAHADASAELPAIALITDAQIVARSRRGERSIAADEFFISHYTTALSDDECVVEVRVPTGPPGAGWSFQEVARRPGDFALVGAAAMVALAGSGAVDRARICLFGVSDRPVRATEVEAALAGTTASPATFDAAAADAAENLEPASDMHGSSAYRRHLARVTVRRALTMAAQRAGAPI